MIFARRGHMAASEHISIKWLSTGALIAKAPTYSDMNLHAVASVKLLQSSVLQPPHGVVATQDIVLPPDCGFHGLPFAFLSQVHPHLYIMLTHHNSQHFSL
jgi:hypothetical protein